MSLWQPALPDALYQNLYAQLAEQLPWHQPRVKVFGREHPTPRLTTWQGENGVAYRYSGLTEVASGWPAVLLPIHAHIEEITGQRFNSVLGNFYRNGQDSMGYHSDDEAELGPQPWIASLSLGASRDFVFRPRTGSQRQCARLALQDNSLLLMSPAVQHQFQHALPRRAGISGGRINLTFRNIVSGQR